MATTKLKLFHSNMDSWSAAKEAIVAIAFEITDKTANLSLYGVMFCSLIWFRDN